MTRPMFGLSCTAVGLRPLPDVLDIATRLRDPLDLSFLELAIGVTCHVDDDYGPWPLVLHDSCLSEGQPDRPLRLRFDLLTPATWGPYRAFISSHRVMAMSVHAPLRSRTDQRHLEAMVHRCSDHLGVPVIVEVMPEPQRWCSSLDTLPDIPLLVDISHVHIWSRGRAHEALRLTKSILDRHNVAGLHLSHNNGHRDSHDLIPEDVWFAENIDEWLADRLVTWESLPAPFAEFERLDVARHRWRPVGPKATARAVTAV